MSNNGLKLGHVKGSACKGFVKCSTSPERAERSGARYLIEEKWSRIGLLLNSVIKLTTQ